MTGSSRPPARGWRQPLHRVAPFCQLGAIICVSLLGVLVAYKVDGLGRRADDLNERVDALNERAAALYEWTSALHEWAATLDRASPQTQSRDIWIEERFEVHRRVINLHGTVITAECVLRYSTDRAQIVEALLVQHQLQSDGLHPFDRWEQAADGVPVWTRVTPSEPGVAFYAVGVGDDRVEAEEAAGRRLRSSLERQVYSVLCDLFRRESRAGEAAEGMAMDIAGVTAGQYGEVVAEASAGDFCYVLLRVGFKETCVVIQTALE